ncbi:MAG TPA: alkaline phosphatase family protein [Methanocellaceae archaeon]
MNGIRWAVPALLLIFIALCGCTATHWSIAINGDVSAAINDSAYGELQNCSESFDGYTGVPLEIFLYHDGDYPITSVSFDNRTYNWTEVAYSAGYADIPMLVLPNGSIYYEGTVTKPSDIDVSIVERPNVSTLEIEPSVLYALGIGGDDELIHRNASRVVIFYVDALGYQRFTDARNESLVDNITSLGETIRAIDVFPSVSIVNSKTLVTGKPPDLEKGALKSYYPDGPTMFDIAEQHGMKALWVDGKATPVSLNQTLYTLDTNGDGLEGDEVADAAIAQYKAGENLMVVHFKDTDTIAHSTGPESPRSKAVLKHTDELIGKIVKSLDNGTVVVVFSDHGGHLIENGGNHGSLLPDDMIVPIVIGYA